MELKAGNIILEYENGTLRYLRTGSCEVLRMIYFTVRDRNWGTVQSRITDETITSTGNSFNISFNCLFEEAEVKLMWAVKIEGTKDSEVRFTITGTALTTFQKNRAGFCVLHPIEECAGKSVLVRHPDGSDVKYLFPEYVSPHQPFIDIAGMKWQPSSTCKATLEFSGDLFETEDHRNWSDNNFKTYCTPLSIPFPATVNTGDKIEQIVFLKVEETKSASTAGSDVIKIDIDNRKKIKIPPVGVGLGADDVRNYPHIINLVSGIGFHHCRVDLKLNDKNWPSILANAIEQCIALKTKLELCLFADETAADDLHKVENYISDKSVVASVVLLPLAEKCINSSAVQQLVPILRKSFPGVPIGGGTDNFFTELNRSSLSADDLDFVQYSVNPQVHAFDNASMIENAGAQSTVLSSASKKFGKPVHISPITLKMRYNADATDKHNADIPADPRQKTNFAAGWTLASLKYAIEGGVKSLTYYQAFGDKGIASGDNDGKPEIFPVAEIFNFLLSKKWDAVLGSSSSKPFSLSSLVLTSGDETCVLLANHTNEKQKVVVDLKNGQTATQHTLLPEEIVSIPGKTFRLVKNQ